MGESRRLCLRAFAFSFLRPCLPDLGIWLQVVARGCTWLYVVVLGAQFLEPNNGEFGR